MKSVSYTLTLAVLAATLSISLSSAQADTIRVFLLGGQSNAEGHGGASGLPSYLLPSQTEVDLYYNNSGSSSVPKNQVIYLQPGASAISGWFGPELTFGRDMATHYAGDPNSSVAIIKYAAGGTNLYSDWAATGGTSYNTFKNTVTAGLVALAATHPQDEVQVAGMIWMQGEADLQSIANRNAYAANLTNFISAMRNLYGAEMPFVIGQLSDNQTCFTDGSLQSTSAADLAAFQAAQASVAAVDPFTGLVVTNGAAFTVRQDEEYAVHFDAAGQMALGSGFATEMQSLLATDVPEPSTIALLLTAIAGLFMINHRFHPI